MICRLPIAFALTLASAASAQYEPPATYYNTATGTGATLKGKLYDIIDGPTGMMRLRPR